MLATQRYQIFKSSWGIVVQVTAEAIPLSSFSGTAMEITPAVRLTVEQGAGVRTEDLEYLIKGLQLVAEDINRARKTDEPLIIRILDLWYSICDYQEEGTACVIAIWAAGLFGFPAPEIPVTFDKGQNKYIFDFEKPANR